MFAFAAQEIRSALLKFGVWSIWCRRSQAVFRGVGSHKQCFVEKFQLDRRVGLVQIISLLCRQLVLEESLRSVCPFVSVCCCSVRIFTSKRNDPSLRAPRAEKRLTVYRALRSWAISHQRALFWKNFSILPTLVPAVLELQNFPGPLAFRITIHMVLAPAGQLFIKIWPQGREIFKILCQNFWKKRMHFWREFAPLLCQ